MISILKGICHLCQEEKLIPVMRDNYGICEECNRRIKADLDVFNIIECSVCYKYYSPLWGKCTNKTFVCKNCLPEGFCGICGEEKRLPFIGQDENGYFLFCRDCNENLVSSI